MSFVRHDPQSECFGKCWVTDGKKLMERPVGRPELSIQSGEERRREERGGEGRGEPS
jgi:hypothetical protein